MKSQKITQHKKEIEQTQLSQSHIFAIFEQPQTINILSYLNKKESNTLQFISPNQDQKKSKEFHFQKFHNLTDKFKYTFSDEIRLMVNELLLGKNQAAFIYGTDQFKKDKILIGESQNSGLLLTVLAQIFQACYKRELQDKVTLKLSCAMYRDGAFNDVFGATQQEISLKLDKNNTNINQIIGNNRINGNYLCNDLFQKKYLIGIPEIILRNMKTGLKIINILFKQISDRREQREQNTDNLIFTIKMQMDKSIDKYDNVNEYLISKLHIVKLANPSINNSMNGLTKSNNWFINFFNYLQDQALSKEKLVKPTESHLERDQFTTFLTDNVLMGVSQVYNFTSITNKMTSNECLTAFKFNSYLKSYKSTQKQIQLNLTTLKEEKNTIQFEIMNIFKNKKESLTKNKERQKTIRQPFDSKSFHRKQSQTLKKYEQCEYIKQAIQLQQSEIILLLLKMTQATQKYMQLSNIVQYEYACVLTVACDKLSKYIFNEQVEDFYYAKKSSIQISDDLKISLRNLFQFKFQNEQLQRKILKKLNFGLNRLKKFNFNKDEELDLKQSAQMRDISNLLTISNKLKELLERLFLLYNTMSFHYIYEGNQQFCEFLQKQKQRISAQLSKKSTQLQQLSYQQLIESINRKINIKKQQEQPNQDQSKNNNQNVNSIVNSNVNSKIMKQQSFDGCTLQKRDTFNEKQNGASKFMSTTFAKDFIKKRKQQDELEKMFTNTNAFIKHKR